MVDVARTRRERRGTRITVAVVLLGVATCAFVAVLATGDGFLIGAAGVFVLSMAWVSLRLAWDSLVTSRYEHAVDRTELARAYRDLFAERAVEHAGFVDDMETRIHQRDDALEQVRSSLSGISMRAVEAEASAQAFRGRLSVAHDQIAAMDTLITAQVEQERRREEAARLEAEARPKPPLRGARRRDPLRTDTVPEWAQLEPDPVDALMAWEQHAGRLVQEQSAPGRHAAG